MDSAKDIEDKLPMMRVPPRTRSGTRKLQEEFNKAVSTLMNQQELEDITEKLDKLALHEDQDKLDANRHSEVIAYDGPSLYYDPYAHEWPVIPRSQGLSLFSIEPKN